MNPIMGSCNLDANPGLADPLVSWQRRLPLKAVLTGKPKGRTIKALKMMVQKLLGNDSTQSDGFRLKAYMGKVIFADQLRPPGLAKLPAMELRTIVAALAEDVSFTPEINTALLEHKLASLLKDGTPAEVVDCAFPWPALGAEVRFDPLSPQLSCIGWSTNSTIESFKRVLFVRYIAPMIALGREKSEVLFQVASLLADRFEAQDLCELDAQSAVLCEEVLTCCKVLRSLVRFPLSAEVDEDMQRIEADKGKSSKSLYSIVGTAVMSQDWFFERWTALRKALPVIAEIGEHIEGALKDLNETPMELTLEGFQAMQSNCRVVMQARAANLPPELITPFITAVAASIKRHLTTEVLRTTKLSEDAAAAADLCLQSACAAFPSELALVECHAALKAGLKDRASAALIGALSVAMEGLPKGLAGVELQELHKAVSALQGAASECVGLTLDGGHLQGVHSVIASFATAFGTWVASDAMVYTIELVLSAWETMCELLGAGDHDEWLNLAVATWRLAVAKTSLQRLQHQTEATSDTVWEELQELGTLQMSCATLLEKCLKLHHADYAKEMIKCASDVKDGAKNFLTEVLAQFKAKRLQTMKDAQAAAESETGGFLNGPSWHAGVRPSESFSKLEAKAKPIFENVELQKLKTKVDAFSASVDNYISLLRSYFESECDDDSTAAQAALRKLTIFRIEATLVWHMKAERCHDTLRTRVQAEIRDLRATGIAEKEVLHPVVFKRAVEALRMKGK